MKKEIVYVAFNGKRFDTEIECRNYENVYNAINTLDDYCRQTECENCPFSDSSKTHCNLIKEYTATGWFKLPSSL